MRKFIIFILLLVFNLVFIYGINYANRVMLKNNFMIYLNEKEIVEIKEDEEETEIVADTNFGGESIEQIVGKFENIFRETYLEGYGEYIVKNAILKSVNPYLIGGIILESTNCRIDCSILLKHCNNVSGMKEKNGSGCFGGSYRYYNSIEDGISDLIKKINTDYYDVETQAPYKMYGSYGKDTIWAFKVSEHMEDLKNGRR